MILIEPRAAPVYLCRLQTPPGRPPARRPRDVQPNSTALEGGCGGSVSAVVMGRLWRGDFASRAVPMCLLFIAPRRSL